MKTATLFGLGLLAVLPLAAAAQNYRPFRAGFSYQLSENTVAGDTAHVLRLRPGLQVGADSVFQLSRRASRGTTWGCGQYVDRPDNLFGAQLTIRPNGDALLTAANGRSLLLQPRAALGRAWQAAQGLTAVVTSRGLGTVLGQPDSLLTIAFSDGKGLVLSKKYGWVSGPALGHYLDPRLPQRQLVLTALPEARLGQPVTGPFVVYDFQPGDLFLHHETQYSFTLPCRFEVWTRDSVASRYDSPGGDSIVYQIRTRSLQQGCGATVLSAYAMRRLVITSSYGGLGRLTSFWGNDDQPPAATFAWLHLPAWRTAALNGRPVQQHMAFASCTAASAADTTGLFDTGNLDNGAHMTTAPGLGVVQTVDISFSGGTSSLYGYQKGTETWGQLPTFAQLLPTAVARPAASTAAFPNPFADELTVRFELARPQAVALELHDALGRVVLARPAQLLPAGPAQLQLATSALPAGVYTALLKPAAGPVQALRVVKQ